jgi:hypothetical protein
MEEDPAAELVWLGTTATASDAYAERTRGVAWLEPQPQGKISYPRRGPPGHGGPSEFAPVRNVRTDITTHHKSVFNIDSGDRAGDTKTSTAPT